MSIAPYVPGIISQGLMCVSAIAFVMMTIILKGKEVEDKKRHDREAANREVMDEFYEDLDDLIK